MFGHDKITRKIIFFCLVGTLTYNEKWYRDRFVSCMGSAKFLNKQQLQQQQKIYIIYGISIEIKNEKKKIINNILAIGRHTVVVAFAWLIRF